MVRVRPLAFALAAGALAALGVIAGTASAGTSLPVDVTASAKMPYAKVMPALLPNARENTSVIAQNNGDAPATIALDIYLPSGIAVSGATKIEANVPPGGTRSFAQAANAGLVPGFRGLGVISSDQPINALLVRDLEQNGTYRHGYSLHNAYGSGANKLTLPFVANNYQGYYQTRFAIANTGATTACVSVQYAYVDGGSFTDNGPGGGGCGSGYPVPANGQIAFGPNSVPAEGTTAMPGATAGKLMAATITSTGSEVTVAADSYTLNLGVFQVGSYDGFVVDDSAPTTDDIGTTLSAPIAIKVDGFYTQFLMSNTNATAANVVITYKSQTGQTYVANRVVPANGTANQGVYDTDGVPEGFTGAATITSDQPIAALVIRSKMTTPGSYVYEDLYTAVSAVPTDRATTSAKLPLIFRRAYGNNANCDASGSNCGYNSWVNITVVGGDSATVTLTTIGDTTTGAPGCTNAGPFTDTFTITNGSQIFYQNLTDNAGGQPNGLGANPGCVWGGMEITSTAPILAVGNVTSDIVAGDNDGLYNAFTN